MGGSWDRLRPGGVLSQIPRKQMRMKGVVFDGHQQVEIEIEDPRLSNNIGADVKLK